MNQEKLQTNDLPEAIWERVLENGDALPISFDANADGTRAVLAVQTEDAECPEIWMYDSQSGELKRVDNHMTIDMPLSRAFFDEGDGALICVDDNESTPYVWRLSMKDGLACNCTPLQPSDHTAHITAKLSTVESLLARY